MKSTKPRISVFRIELLVYLLYLFIFLFFVSFGSLFLARGTSFNPYISPMSILTIYCFLFAFTVLTKKDQSKEKKCNSKLYVVKLVFGLLLAGVLSVFYPGVYLETMYVILVILVGYERLFSLSMATYNKAAILTCLLLIAALVPLATLLSVSPFITFILGASGMLYLYLSELLTILNFSNI